MIVGASLAGGQGGRDAARGGLRRPGRADRRGDRAAVRAAAAVQGLPARRGTAGEGLPARAAAGTPRTTSSGGRAPSAVALDLAARTVTAASRRHRRLRQAATGNRLQGPNADHSRAPTWPGVRYLRTLDQADALLAGFQARRHVVVVGAGWIGLETAAAARQHGCAVTVVEMDSLPLRRVLGDEVATVYRDLHAAHGVDFRFGAGLREISRRRRSGAPVSCSTTAGRWPPIWWSSGSASRPAVELAEAAGLEVDNGVVTDALLRTSDPAVFACGDVASSFNPLLGTRLRVEHWANALNGGPAAARSMLGRARTTRRCRTSSPTSTTSAWNTPAGSTPGEYDRVVFRGDPDRRP